LASSLELLSQLRRHGLQFLGTSLVRLRTRVGAREYNDYSGTSPVGRTAT
jgi:hypothetical protein